MNNKKKYGAVITAVLGSVLVVIAACDYDTFTVQYDQDGCTGSSACQYYEWDPSFQRCYEPNTGGQQPYANCINVNEERRAKQVVDGTCGTNHLCRGGSYSGTYMTNTVLVYASSSPCQGGP